MCLYACLILYNTKLKYHKALCIYICIFYGIYFYIFTYNNFSILKTFAQNKDDRKKVEKALNSSGLPSSKVRNTIRSYFKNVLIRPMVTDFILSRMISLVRQNLYLKLFSLSTHILRFDPKLCNYLMTCEYILILK